MKYNFKRNFTPKSISVILGAMLLVTAFSNMYYSEKTNIYKTRTENQYRRSFAEIVQYINTIETNLAKGAVVTNPKSMIKLSGEIYNTALQAEADLGQLILNDSELDNMMRFLSQVGDYTYSLSMKYIDGGTPTEEENKTLSEMSKYASDLNKMLLSMQEDVYSGKISLDNELMGNGKRAMASEFKNIEEKFANYPSLIYDGPFSDHREKSKPKLLEGEKEYSKEECEKRVREIVNEKGFDKITYEGESGGKVPSYIFSVKNDDSDRNITLQITKQGKALLWMLDNRTVHESKITPQKAVKKGEEYLKLLGFTAMQESYYEIKSNIITVNYAYTQDGVVVYPDLVKVKIAMDNGEILGAECKGYISNHTQRSFNKKLITEQEAKALLSKTVTADRGRLAVIPLESDREVLCYEFLATNNKNQFLIYINAETGKEENVLMLKVSNEGTLTI